MPAWPGTLTAIASAVLTAAQWNTYVRDALQHLKDAVDAPDRPGCRAKRSTNQSVAQNTYDAVQFDAEDYDYSTAMHDNVTNNTRITIPASKGGKYLIGGVAAVQNGATEIRVRILKNGTDTVEEVRVDPVVGAQSWVSIVTEAALAAGDYIELQVRHTGSGGALNVAEARFWARWQAA